MYIPSHVSVTQYWSLATFNFYFKSPQLIIYEFSVINYDIQFIRNMISSYAYIQLKRTGGMKMQSHSSTLSALNRRVLERSLSRCSQLTGGKGTNQRCPFYGNAGVNQCRPKNRGAEKTNYPVEMWTSMVQFVTSHFTHWAIQAYVLRYLILIIPSRVRLFQVNDIFENIVLLNFYIHL
jgi:hypothetical protein